MDATRRLASLLFVSFVLAGCNPAPIVVVGDAGVIPPPDAPRPDGGPPPIYSCDGEVMVVNGVLGETEMLTFDTSMTSDRPRDLGLACGNTATTADWAPQIVLEYHVPGTGRVGVEFDTALSGTAANFNTLVQVRESCGDVPTSAFPPNCFDDQSATEPRARGGFDAMGGDVVYLIVTAYSDPEAAAMQVDQGPLSIALTPRANTPPTLETISVLLNGEATLVDVTATDAEGPIGGYALSLYTAAGQIDFDGDGVREPEDVLIFPFDSVTGTAPQMGHHEITPMDDGYQIATFCRNVGCTQAGIAVFDASYATSATMMVDIVEAEIVGPGEICDATHVCGTGTVCNASMVCELTPAAMAVCASATPIVIAMPVDATPTTASVTGSVAPGAGQFLGSCTNGMAPEVASRGTETVYTVELTGTGPYDLVLTTARPGTGTRDTILYARSECGDPASELACTDDNAAMTYQSTITMRGLGPGIYYAFVEIYGGATAPSAFELQATLTLAP